MSIFPYIASRRFFKVEDLLGVPQPSKQFLLYETHGRHDGVCLLLFEVAKKSHPRWIRQSTGCWGKGRGALIVYWNSAVGTGCRRNRVQDIKAIPGLKIGPPIEKNN